MVVGAPRPRRIRILLVCGNGKGREMMDFLSRNQSFEVFWVELLAEATVVLRQGRFSPHVIVLDTELPDSDGVATAISVLRLAGQTPVVALSDDDETEQRALRKGVSACIPRSVAGAEDVIRAIHGCVGDYTPVPVDTELRYSDTDVRDMVSRVRAVMEG